MASNTPTQPPSGASGSGTGGTTGGPTLPAVSAARIKAAASSNLSIPSGTTLDVLSGQNWNAWSGVLCAILQFLDVDSILTHDTCPSGVDAEDWSTIQKKTTAYLR